MVIKTPGRLALSPEPLANLLHKYCRECSPRQSITQTDARHANARAAPGPDQFWKVSQELRVPSLTPLANHSTRCFELP